LDVLNTSAATAMGVPARSVLGVSVTPRTSAAAGRTATVAVVRRETTDAAAVTTIVNSFVETRV
jgi:hypothetical protein